MLLAKLHKSCMSWRPIDLFILNVHIGRAIFVLILYIHGFTFFVRVLISFKDFIFHEKNLLYLIQDIIYWYLYRQY